MVKPGLPEKIYKKRQWSGKLDPVIIIYKVIIVKKFNVTHYSSIIIPVTKESGWLKKGKKPNVSLWKI